MILKYISSWIIILFLVWSIGYLLNNKLITNYINPYYGAIFMCIGYTFTMLYTIFIKKHNYQLSTIFALTLVHFIPLIVSHFYVKNKFTQINFIIIVILYLLYTLLILSKTPFNIYYVDKYPTLWRDLV